MPTIFPDDYLREIVVPDLAYMKSSSVLLDAVTASENLTAAGLSRLDQTMLVMEAADGDSKPRKAGFSKATTNAHFRDYL